MTIYEKNLETLAAYYPEMDTMVEEAKRSVEQELEIFEENSCDGRTILKIKKEDKICYLNGKRNTVAAAEMWVKTLGELQRNAPILIMGLGNSTYLEELMKKTENRVCIIVYEPSIQIFFKFLETVDIASWMEKQLIIFWVNGLKGMDTKHMRGILQRVLKYEMLVYMKHFILPNYEVLFPEEAVEFMKMCRDIALRELSDYNTKYKFSGLMVKNLFSNARYLCRAYKTTQLPDVIPRDIPGIVVAAGPSLNKNIQELKKAKGKAFIIAVDTAIKPLLKNGIIPDMFAIVDAMKPLDLVKMEEAKEIPLVTTLNASPEILDYHKGMKFFYNEGYQFAESVFLRTGQKIGKVSNGGSVATSAFSLLYKIGISTIILVGQDLAYTNNKSHADGTFQEIMKEENTSRFMMVEGNFEDKVPTRPDFKLFLDWYNMYIEGCKGYRGNFRVINATEGGAKIQNTEIMTLREAIDRECTKEVDIQKSLSQLSPMLSEGNQAWAVEYFVNMPKRFQQLVEDAKKAKKLYQKLNKICNRKKIDKKEYLNILKKLAKQIKILEKQATYQLVEITMSAAQYILRGEQDLQEDSFQAEGKEIARKGILYIDNVIDMAILFQEYSEEIFGEDFKEQYENL